VSCLVGMGRGVRGGRGKEGQFGLMRILWNIFPATQFLSNFLEFTQYLISSIIELLNRSSTSKQHSTIYKCPQIFQKSSSKSIIWGPGGQL
jgi:hypothetical protein